MIIVENFQLKKNKCFGICRALLQLSFKMTTYLFRNFRAIGTLNFLSSYSSEISWNLLSLFMIEFLILCHVYFHLKPSMKKVDRLYLLLERCITVFDIEAWKTHRQRFSRKKGSKFTNFIYKYSSLIFVR